MTNVRKAEEYINAHPRCVARDVAEFAGTTTDCISPALTWLTEKGRVQRRREAIAERGIRVQWVYYPAAAELAVPEQPAPKQLARGLDDAITPEDLVKAVVVEPETAPRTITKHPLTDAIDAFVEAIAEYIANQVAEKVLLKAGALHRTPAGAESPRTRKPKVAIIGLMPQQQGIVSSEYGDAFDLVFPDRERTGRIKELRADRIYVMTRFVSHAVTEALKAAKLEFELVPGGMSDLGRLLYAAAGEWKCES